MTVLAARPRREAELIAAVIARLFAAFASARSVAIFVADGDRRGSAIYGRERGGALKAARGGGVDALPAESRELFASVRSLPCEGGERGALMVAPLRDGVGLLGLVVVELKPLVLDISAADHAALASVARHLSRAVLALRAEQRRRRAHRLQRDLVAARQLQRSFLPTLGLSVGGCPVASEYRPAFAVGGDFYELTSSAPGRLTAVIGDVAGKGVAGALLMSRVSAEVRRLAASTRSSSELLQQLNRAFAQLGDEAFFTAACVRIDVTAGWLEIANAGHVLPLVRRASGAVLPLGRASGPPIGMLSDERYGDERFAVAPGDMVLLMSDGVLEALHGDDDQLGMWTLLDVVARAPRDVAEINRRILSAVEQRVGAAPPDDITLLTLELRRPPTRRGYSG